MIAFLRDLNLDIACVGLEAGPLSKWLVRHLREAGFEAVLMETRQVKGALKAMPIKTDRRDALGSAQLIRMGWFRPVHCKSVSAQELRALLGARRTLQKSMISIELSMRGMLRGFGLKLGHVRRQRLPERARELAEGNEMLTAMVTSMLRGHAALRSELARLETVTLHVPFRVVKRGGRKEMQMPEGATQSRRTDSTLVKALAHAFRWKRMLESGEFATIAELAEREAFAPSYMTRVLRLTQLDPGIVEAILDGRKGGADTLARLMESFPLTWSEQRSYFAHN